MDAFTRQKKALAQGSERLCFLFVFVILFYCLFFFVFVFQGFVCFYAFCLVFEGFVCFLFLFLRDLFVFRFFLRDRCGESVFALFALGSVSWLFCQFWDDLVSLFFSQLFCRICFGSDLDLVFP